MWIGFVYHLSLDGHFVLITTLRHILSTGSCVDLLIILLNLLRYFIGLFALFWWSLFIIYPEKTANIWHTTTGFPNKWHLRNERRNSILMMHHYPDMGSASDWLCRVENLFQPIRSTTQIWVVTLRQYGISALVSQVSYGGETSGSVVKCRLFSQAIYYFHFIFYDFIFSFSCSVLCVTVPRL